MRKGLGVIGYARVSTDGQTLDAQQAAFIAAGLNGSLLRRLAGRSAIEGPLRRLGCARGRGCVASDQARSASPQHQGPAKYASGYR